MTDDLTPSERVAAARAAVAEAKARAEYHGWTGASANAYTRAKADYRAAKRAARRGCFHWRPAHTLLAMATVLSVLSVLAMYQASHGGAF